MTKQQRLQRLEREIRQEPGGFKKGLALVSVQRMLRWANTLKAALK